MSDEPFGAMIGDRVVVLLGPDAGARGRVDAYGPRPAVVLIELDAGRRVLFDRANLARED